MSLPDDRRDAILAPVADDGRPRYTLFSLFAALTAVAGVLGLLRVQATLTVVWLIATGALYGSLGVAVSHRAAWRRPAWLRLGCCGLIALAAGGCLMAAGAIEPAFALVGALACLVVGTCLAFQLRMGEVLLTVFALFLPAFLAVLSAGALLSWLCWGP